MAAPTEIYREFIRRSHSLLAIYLAVYAWRNDLDCVVLDGSQIVKFWGLHKRVETERLGWFSKDVACYFPNVEVLYLAKGGKFASIYLARRPFPLGAFRASIPDRKRTQELTSKGLNAAVANLPSEAEMLAILTSAIHGLAEFPAVIGSEK